MKINHAILEITKTEIPVFSSGLWKASSSIFPDGVKVKSSQTGTLKVHYRDDAPGTLRDLEVSSSNAWDLPDVIDEIHETGTTVTLSNVLVGA